MLRLGPGDALPAIGPDGRAYDCVIESLDRSGLDLRVTPAAAERPAYLPDVRGGAQALDTGAARPGSGAPGLPRFVLAVAMLKGSKLDEVVRAATEAGASAIVPLATSRSMGLEGGAARLGRLRRVIDEALGQSGAPVATRLEPPRSFEAFRADYPVDGATRLGLYFHEAPLAQASLHRYCSVDADEIVACVGPEGGWSDEERRSLAESGYEPAWLGPTVLRAETAAVFALASLRIICLERSAWLMRE